MAYDAAEKVDAAASLAPWLAVNDDGGKPIAASAALDGRPPLLPAGALEAARSGENRVTWQPRPGLRVATVICRFDGRSKGFVVAGRSLREAERHIANLGRLGALGVLAALAASLAAAVVFARWSTR